MDYTVKNIASSYSAVHEGLKTKNSELCYDIKNLTLRPKMTSNSKI